MNEHYSVYPEEQEVLLYDGLEFYVIAFDLTVDDKGNEIAYYKLYHDSVYQIPENIN